MADATGGLNAGTGITIPVFTSANSNLTPVIYARQTLREVLRLNQFRPFMGAYQSSSPIAVFKEKTPNIPGRPIRLPYIQALVGAGRTDNEILSGYEEKLESNKIDVKWDLIRHGVSYGEYDQDWDIIRFESEGQRALRNWAAGRLDKAIYDSLESGLVGGTRTKPVQALGETGLTFIKANSDRIYIPTAGTNDSNEPVSISASSTLGTLFGTAFTNTGDNPANITLERLSRFKVQVQKADPMIEPIRTGGGRNEQYYICLVSPETMYKLRFDDNAKNLFHYVRERNNSNPLITGADFIWDGLIFYTMRDLGTITLNSKTTEVAYILGRGAIGAVFNRLPTIRTQRTDYQHWTGIGITFQTGVQNLVRPHKRATAGVLASTATNISNGIAYGLFAT